jgi:hypothetical protein
MVMIDLGHEKKSLGVISVTHVTETLRSNAAQADDAWAYPQVTALGVERGSVSSTQKSYADR